ncbi:SMP-30/gluconolactonase/LRE family protein [Fibrella arboris]|uniref:SMP-30/gluconolactonase/LRE family protein n=1 Tax=Fibrella arboris TaxID=3242486 RepID=UPI003522CDE6
MRSEHQINPLKGWQVDRETIQFLGHDLQRPECILAERDGTIWTADARGGVMRLRPDGSQQLITPFTELSGEAGRGNGTSFENRYVQAQGSLPNGLCFSTNGDFLMANWGTDAIEQMTRDGHLTTLCTEIDGRPLGKANFPLRDSKGRTWFSVTTRTQPWTRQLTTRATDGYVAVMDEKGVRIAADGFCGTNEIRFDPAEEWLYVVESTGHKISRLRLQPDGSLTDRETYGPESLGGFPDGFAFDAFGNLWITLIFTDELIALTPDGELLTLLDDSQPDTKKRLLSQFEAGTLTPEILSATHGTLAPWMASLTFGGPDLQTVYLGSLRGTSIPYFRSPVPGQPMMHW